MNTVLSKDGTAIAYQRFGSGPAVILVDGALCSRAFGPMPKLAPLLAERFTVFVYDRRGRGDSGDSPTYAKQREIEDIAALVAEAGGEAAAVGLSSGAALALEAAAAGVPIRRLALYEPPYLAADKEGRQPPQDCPGKLKALIAAGRRSAAVRFFMVDIVGMPTFVGWLMRLMPGWSKLKAVAHTLVYDTTIMGDFTVPAERFAKVAVPTLLLAGEKSPRSLRMAAQAAADSVPGASHAVLKGQTHNVSLPVLAPELERFLAA